MFLFYFFLLFIQGGDARTMSSNEHTQFKDLQSIIYRIVAQPNFLMFLFYFFLLFIQGGDARTMSSNEHTQFKDPQSIIYSIVAQPNFLMFLFYFIFFFYLFRGGTHEQCLQTNTHNSKTSRALYIG